MPLVTATIIDDLAPDLVSFSGMAGDPEAESAASVATLSPDGVLRLGWLPVTENLDGSDYRAANRGTYLVYGSCTQPSALPAQAGPLLSGPDGPGVPLGSYAACAAGISDDQVVPLWFAVIAQDSKQNPAENRFDEDTFASWRAWGLPLVRVDVPAAYFGSAPAQQVSLPLTIDVQPLLPFDPAAPLYEPPAVPLPSTSRFSRWPVQVDPITLSSCYGERKIRNEQGQLVPDWTGGIDIAVGEGTPVYAVADGVVHAVCVNPYQTYGTSHPALCNGHGSNIIIRHGEAFYTRYSHLGPNMAAGDGNEFAVHVGDTVRAGQLIGYSGNTGASRGPHLDFKVYLREPTPDPSDPDRVDYFPEQQGNLAENPICFLPNSYAIGYTDDAASCVDDDGTGIRDCVS